MTAETGTVVTKPPAGASSALAGESFGTFRPPDELRFVAASGNGAYLTDTAGRRWLDLVMGSGAVLLGHSHPAVVEAVGRQLPLGQTFYVLNEPALQLADLIAELVPSAESVKLVGSGADATFAALRIARAFTGREEVLKFEGAYHGHHDYGLWSVKPSDPPAWPRGEPDSAGIPGAIGKLVRIAPFNNLEAAEQAFERHGRDLAAVIVEPVQRAIPPEPGFLEGLRELCDRYGALLVFDEVVTGFRLALGGAQERYGVMPDLTTLAKTIGGGLPMGAVAGRRELLALSVPGSSMHSYVSGTLNGNPLSASAGLATLRHLRDTDALARVTNAAVRLREGLLTACASVGVQAQVLGVPPILELVFGDQPVRDWRSYATTDWKLIVRWGHEMLRRGVFVNPMSKLYVSSAHDDEAIDLAVAMAEDALHAALGRGDSR